MNSAVTTLNGYETVSDLIPQGSLWRYHRIWYWRLEQTLDSYGDLHDGLFIGLANDYSNPINDIIELQCLDPQVLKYPGRQVSGLDIRYCDMQKTHGWDKGYYELYDFEEGDIHIKCEQVRIQRRPRDDVVSYYREWV